MDETLTDSETMSMHNKSLDSSTASNFEVCDTSIVKVEFLSNVQVFDNAWSEARVLIIRAEDALQKASSVDIGQSMERFREFIQNISTFVLKQIDTGAQQCIEFASSLIRDSSNSKWPPDSDSNTSLNETLDISSNINFDCFKDNLNLKKEFDILDDNAEYNGDKEIEYSHELNIKVENFSDDVENAPNRRKNLLIDKINNKTKRKSTFECDICYEKCLSRRLLSEHVAERHMTDEEQPVNCLKCDKNYPNRLNFLKHMREIHPQANCNECGACGKIYKDLRGHMLRVHAKRYKCDKCGKCLARRSILIVHRRIHSNERPYSCSYCPLSFRSLECLKSHETTHKDREIPCDVCGKLFKKQSAMKLHRKNMHSDDRPFVCKECNKRFVSSGELKKHQFVHTGVSKHQCPSCKKYFIHAYKLKKHMKTHSKAAEMNKGGIHRMEQQPIFCSKCENNFMGLKLFIKHMKSDHPELPQNECGVCGKTAKDIIHHMRRVHEKLYRCEVCDKRMARKTEYIVHMRIHTNDRPFQCDLCDSKFRSKETLAMHKKYHVNKPVECKICHKIYKNATSLRIHLKERHHGSKHLVCDQCGKSFSSKFKLEVHVFTHTRVSDFYCSICNKYFPLYTRLKMHNDMYHKGNASNYRYLCPICGKTTSRSTKKYHILSHKGVRALLCDMCPKTFAWPSALREHKRLHHAKTPTLYIHDVTLTQMK